jgi:ABC-type uncharacterized transport system ATPase subunit
MSTSLAVELVGVTKRYPRVVANEDATLDVRTGEIHAIVGENGAGKSTLMKMLAGVTRPDAGTIRVRGRALVKHTPEEAAQAGVGMVFQHFVLVPTLSVAENVVLGREPRRGPWLDRAAAAEEVRALSATLGMDVDPTAEVGRLPIGVQQRVEILKVLARRAEVLILDEPTAILTPQEVDDLLAVLRRLAAEGKTIVLVTHKLREVMAVADRVTVLRHGRTVATLEARDTTADAIAELMVGRPPRPLTRPEAREPGEVVLEATGLVVHSERGAAAVHGISLTVRAGEIVGVAGIEGNGQSELVQCLVGLRPAEAGQVRLGGVDVTRASIAERRARGLAHVPEDRHLHGVVLDFSVEENVILGAQASYRRGLGLDRARMRTDTTRVIAEHDVRPPHPEVLMSALSGGNQQKVVIGRELSRTPRLLVAAHPTRGLDLGAIEHVDQALVAARAAGTAVLLVSAELSELLAIADRVLVMFGGRVVGELDPTRTDERTLGALMAGRTEARV